MRFFLFHLLLLVLISQRITPTVHADPGEVHGPICSWHLDPTSTMTIQWIERVNASIPNERWWEATAGFGYGDDDDETSLDMADKYQRLYIRKEFEGKDLPTVAEIDVTGKWKATSKIDKLDYTFDVDFLFKDDKLTGTITQAGGKPQAFDSGYVTGETVHVMTTFTLITTTYTVEISATKKDAKLEGEWRALNKDGEEKAKDKLILERVISEEEKTKTEEEKKKAEKKVINPAAFEMQLHMRYDDGFIAYLNGEEILRKGVPEGGGKDAKGIENHESVTDGDKNKFEIFVIDKKFNRFLTSDKNILAIEGHNDKLSSTDFTLDPKFWVKVDKKELKYIEPKDKWQFFLGDPPESWKTGEIKSKKLPLVGEGLPSYELRYGEREGTSSLTNRAVAEILPFADTRQVIHRVILRGLKPDTEYAFHIHRQSSPDRLKNRKYFFKTAPTTARDKLTFVTGGDMYHKRPLLDAMNIQASKHDPLFALLGGDLAYANGKDANKWYDWVDSWHDWCITNGDHMIPMVVVIGNHECSKEIHQVKPEELKDYKPEENAKFFYSLFPLPEKVSNYALDFGDYMSIICLDSNHTQKPETQVPWLKEALKKRANVPNLFACYHRPTYGTLVKDDEMEVRKHFVPLFDTYGVDAAFENDHHVYKRTSLLKKDEVHPDGTLYIGDGSWGVDTRDIPWAKANKLDYLVRAAKENHLIRVQLFPNRQQFDAFKGNGDRIDSTARFRR
ncbi:MAG: hypothetical protein ACI9DF_001087 [Verrucomicrobiales bacterium]|jgi:hypothetical protein